MTTLPKRRSFVEEACELGQGRYIAQPMLFAAYQQWCLTEKQPAVKKGSFYRRIRNMLGITSSQRRIDGKSSKTFEGISLKDPPGAVANSLSVIKSADQALRQLDMARMILELIQILETFIKEH